MKPLEAAYLSAKDRLGEMSLEQFKDAIRDFEIHPVVVDGECAGAILVAGFEIHACVLPSVYGRWVNRAALRLMNDVIEKHGFAQTHALTQAGQEFVERLGFVRHGNGYRRDTKWALRQY